MPIAIPANDHDANYYDTVWKAVIECVPIYFPGVPEQETVTFVSPVVELPCWPGLQITCLSGSVGFGCFVQFQVVVHGAKNDEP